MESTPTKKLAISYTRYSTPEQSGGDSRRRQTTLARDYCERNGLTLIENRSYFDDGVSAFRGANKTSGELGTLLQDAEAGLFPEGTYLIVESLDRLGREPVTEQLNFFLRLLKTGLTLVTFDGRSAEEYTQHTVNLLPRLLNALLIMSRANEESRVKSERLKQAWIGKRQKAHDRPLTRMIPAWLEIVDGKIVANEYRASIVKEIFQLANSGVGKRGIAQILNERNEPSWSSLERNPKGLWWDSYIEKILTNPAAIGVFQPHCKVAGKREPTGEEMRDYYPAVVSESEFFAAAARKSKRAGKAGRFAYKAKNLFAGLARCMKCGGTLRYTDKGSGWVYLTCEQRALKAGTCRAKPTSYSKAERLALLELAEVDWPAILDSNREAPDAVIPALNGKIREVQRKIDNLTNCLADGSVGFDSVRKKLGSLEEEHSGLRSQLEQLEEETQRRKLDARMSLEAAGALEEFVGTPLELPQRGRLKQSISNLLSNLFFESRDDGTVLMFLTTAGGRISFVKALPDDQRSGLVLSPEDRTTAAGRRLLRNWLKQEGSKSVLQQIPIKLRAA